MKDLWGDRIRVGLTMGYTVSLRIDDRTLPDGEYGLVELTPKKARRLARRLKKAAKAAEEGTA